MEQMAQILVGSVTIETSVALAREAGFWVSSEGIAYESDPYEKPALARIAQALSEGLEGELAVLRAIALRRELVLAVRAREAAQREADTRLAAAQAELRAQQLASARQRRESE